MFVGGGVHRKDIQSRDEGVISIEACVYNKNRADNVRRKTQRKDRNHKQLANRPE